MPARRCDVGNVRVTINGNGMDHPALDSWDRRLAAPMFAAALILLVLLGAASEWIRLGEGRLPPWLAWGLVATYGLFVVEVLFHIVRRDRHWRRRIVPCLLPPLRVCGRDPAQPELIWIPFRGWVARNARLALELERAFSLPMIGVALTILPLLAVEHYRAAALADNPSLRWAVSIATGVIWLAFTLEFFVMVSVVENKFDYCKRHWMDIAVICLPFVAFLRFLRLGQAVRLQQLARMGRAYRLRGLTMRFWRSILLLDLITRVVRRSPERQLDQLRQTIEEKEAELELLRERVAELERQIARNAAPSLSLDEAQPS